MSFSKKSGGVFQSVFCVVPWGGSLLKVVCLIVTVLWDPGMQASPWPTELGDQGVSLTVDCTCSLALTRQLKSAVLGPACLLSQGVRKMQG